MSRRQSITASPQPWARKGDDHSRIKELESLRRSGTQHVPANSFIKRGFAGRVNERNCKLCAGNSEGFVISEFD